MIRMLYFSTASAEFKKSDLPGLVAHAEAANAEQDITGALAYNGRNFCQVLEGEDRAVRDLIERIALDRRHSGFKILDERRISSRVYPDFSLKLVDDLNFGEVINAMNA